MTIKKVVTLITVYKSSIYASIRDNKIKTPVQCFFYYFFTVSECLDPALDNKLAVVLGVGCKGSF